MNLIYEVQIDNEHCHRLLFMVSLKHKILVLNYLKISTNNLRT